MRALAPSAPKDRFDVYRFFNGLSSEAKEGLDRRHMRVPLVKTFLLEHASGRGRRRAKAPAEIFRHLGATVGMLDDRFMALSFAVADETTGKTAHTVTGFLEQYDQRFFAYYTCEDSAPARKRVSGWIQHPDLDAAWFSSPLLQVLWDRDVSHRGNERFGKLVFRHESIFDMPEDSASEVEEEPEECDEGGDLVAEDDGGGDGEREDRPEAERRKARFEMGDRIGKIKAALGKLQEDYNPLFALNAIRLPSRLGRGAHDLYQTGQVTNRSDSFEDHRNTVRYLYRIYNSVLTFTEERAWSDISAETRPRVGMKGVPLIVEFEEPLSELTFNRWVQMAFRKRNQFKLWGDPIRLGPSKVHVYGADRHLWQPINLELARTGIVAILPRGTCGNTFHRLVANIQHYVCPRIHAWVGAEPFESVVGRWPEKAEASDEA